MNANTVFENSIPNGRRPFNRRVFCSLALNAGNTAVDPNVMPVLDGLVKPNCTILIMGKVKLGAFGPDMTLRRLTAI